MDSLIDTPQPRYKSPTDWDTLFFKRCQLRTTTANRNYIEQNGLGGLRSLNHTHTGSKPLAAIAPDQIGQQVNEKFGQYLFQNFDREYLFSNSTRESRPST